MFTNLKTPDSVKRLSEIGAGGLNNQHFGSFATLALRTPRNGYPVHDGVLGRAPRFAVQAAILCRPMATPRVKVRAAF